ncbi:acyltransferase family protein [Duganella sp. HH105]|uniref:acyltransferase family protein n=1 Tax=Duganella sp. HH105 TaxID=1781067 RepID=UPI000877BF97|nr:acyltransferase family protein [Duganella sp. HH105]OEZ56206.1 O-acetyltransferase OatA [Duganella sp. HH105]
MQIEKLPLAPAEADAAPALHPAYRRDIDGLRALAVLSVVLYHAFPARLPGGFAGVDIFFIISGFLIGSILIAAMQQNAFSFAEFYARRVRRIFPALIVVMGACLAFGWFSLFPDEYKMLGKHVFGGAGFLSNFFLWNEVGYFDTAAETKPLLHLWSLGIEEQFYIFWPVLMLLAWKRRFSLAALALGVAALSFLVNVGGLHKFPSATFYSPASRIWELLYGSVLAYMSVNGLSLFAGVHRKHGADTVADWSGPRARNVKSALGLAMLLATLALLRADRHFPGWWALLPTTGAVLLIAAGPQAWCNRVLLGNPVAVWFGLISYPLYLWHWPLLAFARIIESGLPSSKIRGAAVLAAIVLAWLTYRLLERPLRGAAHGRRKVIVLSAAMLALAAAGGALYRANGLPLRASVVDSAAQQKELFVVEDVANAAACKERYGFTSIYEYCLMDDPASKPTVAMVGDSHAFHVWAGLNRYYHGKGENLVYFGTRVPFVGLPAGDDPYQKVVPMMLDKVMNEPTVKTVIISTFARLNIEDEGGKRMTQALHDTIAMFIASGRKVVYISDTPYLDFEPRSCIRRAGVASSQTRTDCSLPRAKQDEQIARHKVAEKQALRDFPTVQVFDAAAQLCDAQRCLVMRENKLLYRDTHHLSHEGDLFMGERYARQMDAAAH